MFILYIFYNSLHSIGDMYILYHNSRSVTIWRYTSYNEIIYDIYFSINYNEIIFDTESSSDDSKVEFFLFDIIFFNVHQRYRKNALELLIEQFQGIFAIALVNIKKYHYIKLKYYHII